MTLQNFLMRLHVRVVTLQTVPGWSSRKTPRSSVVSSLRRSFGRLVALPVPVSCFLGPSGAVVDSVSFLVRHPWFFHPSSAGLVHAHIAFVEQVCKRFVSL